MPKTPPYPPKYWKPTKHSMTRRNTSNNYYTGSKAYMLTLSLEDHIPLLGTIAGDIDIDVTTMQTCPLEQLPIPRHYFPHLPTSTAPQQPASTAPHLPANTPHQQPANTPHQQPASTAPQQKLYSATGCGTSAQQPPAGVHITLTPLGESIRRTLLRVHEYYDDLFIHPDEIVIMPEHLHAIIYVIRNTDTHIGKAIATLKGDIQNIYKHLLLTGRTAPVGQAREWLAAYQAAPPSVQAATHAWYAHAARCPFFKNAPTRALCSATRCGIEQPTTAALTTPATTATTAALATTATAAPTTTAPPATTATAAPATAAAPATSSTQQLVAEPQPSPRCLSERIPPLKVTASGKHVETGFLFRPNYTDTQAIADDDLIEKRRYIRINPYSRLLRSSHHMHAERAWLPTGVTLSALTSYLRRECTARDLSSEKIAAVHSLLLLSSAQPAEIVCSSYGDHTLLQRHLLPVVCHRRDARLFEQQKAACMAAARQGAVLISARISRGEQAIMDAVLTAGFPIILIEDNGFPEIYHPSAARTPLCTSGRLLLLTPWRYHYYSKDDALFVAYSKTMNCIAQAISRTPDSWWKQQQ